MKKLLTVLVFAVLLLALCFCASEEGTPADGENTQVGENIDPDNVDVAPLENENDENAQDETQSDTVNENDNDDEVTEDLMPDNGSEEIALILEGVLDVKEFNSGEKVMLYDLGVVNDMYAGVPSRYALADFNKDGVYELVVEFSLMGDTALINKYDGEWIAHYRSYRGIAGLTDTGVFKWSNSAFDSGMSKLYFLEGRLVEVVMTQRVTEEDGTEKYYVDEKETDYNQYVQRTSELERSGSSFQWTEF